MTANPILAEFLRGNWVENRHRGAICIANADGEILGRAGDIDGPVFPRSAIKAMQALAMFRSGAIETFGIKDSEIAMACASHHGQEAHTRAVAGFLDRIGFGVDDLECGAHPPTNPAARKALRESGERPTALFNNCSGKHAGMLAVARALDVDPKGYTRPDHPVQHLVRECVEAATGSPLGADKCGTDGCSIPTYAAPLTAWAEGFARMAQGHGLDDADAAASRTIFDAATAHPQLIAGTGALDTDVMTAFDGRLMLKVGAEGVFCGALRGTGIGFALKCEDGNKMAAEAMIAALLETIADPDAAQHEVLAGWANQVSRNWRGIEVGTMRATDAARLAL